MPSQDGLLAPIDLGALNSPETWKAALLTGNIFFARAGIEPITDEEAALFGQTMAPVVAKYSLDFEYKEEALLLGVVTMIAMPRVMLAIAQKKEKKARPIIGTEHLPRTTISRPAPAKPETHPTPAEPKPVKLPTSYG